MSHSCNVCQVSPTVSRCTQCNFHFCVQHASFIHLCSEDHVTRKMEIASQLQYKENHLGGIGAWLNKIENTVVVESLVAGGPADKSRQLFKGDIVLEIEGQVAAAVPSCQDLVIGKPGTPVTLLIQRNGVVSAVSIVRDVRNAPTRFGGVEVQEVGGIKGFQESMESKRYHYESGQVASDDEAHFVTVSPLRGDSGRPVSSEFGSYHDGVFYPNNNGNNSNVAYSSPHRNSGDYVVPNDRLSSSSVSSTYLQQQQQQQQYNISPRLTTTTSSTTSSSPTLPSTPPLAGIGVLLSRNGNIVRVESLLTDGPASQVLEIGDAILEIDGHPAASIPSCQDALIGVSGSKVRLAVDRPGVGFFTCEITRRRPTSVVGPPPPLTISNNNSNSYSNVVPMPVVYRPNNNNINNNNINLSSSFDAHNPTLYAPHPFPPAAAPAPRSSSISPPRSQTFFAPPPPPPVSSSLFVPPVPATNPRGSTSSFPPSSSSAKSGIGAVFLRDNGVTAVESLLPGGPAFTHLMVGDIVVAINGAPIDAIGSCQDAVLGAPGTPVSIVVNRRGVGIIECRINRAVIKN